MTPHTSKSAIHSPANRLVGYDFARALAIFGMVIVNFKIVMTADDTASSWLATITGLMEGRAAAVFIILAGAGLSLFCRRARQTGDKTLLSRIKHTVLRRALLLFVIGLLFVPIWPADILHFYSLYLSTGAFLMAAPDRRLWQTAAIAIVGSLVLIMTLNYDAGWQWHVLEYTDFWSPAGMVRHMLFNGFHPYFPWVAFLLAGMWLGRRKLDDPLERRRLIAGGLAVTIASEALAVGLRHGTAIMVDPVLFSELKDFFTTAPIPPSPFYLGSAGGTAIVIIALCMTLADRCSNAGWFKLMADAGRQSLTLYIAHIVVGMEILERFGRLEHQSLPIAVGCATAFSVLALMFVAIWRRFFRYGPAEYLMRKVAG